MTELADDYCADCPACVAEREQKARRCRDCLPYPDGWKCHPCGNWPCTCTTNLLEVS